MAMGQVRRGRRLSIILALTVPVFLALPGSGWGDGGDDGNGSGRLNRAVTDPAGLVISACRAAS